MCHILTSNKIRIPTLDRRFEDETQEAYDARVKHIHKIDTSIAELRQMHRARRNAIKARKAQATNDHSVTKTPAEREAEEKAVRKAALVADKIAKMKTVADHRMQKYFMTTNIIGQRVGRLSNTIVEDQKLVAFAHAFVWTCKEIFGSGRYYYERHGVLNGPANIEQSNIKTLEGHDAAKIEKTLNIRHSIASQLGKLLVAGDPRVTGTDALAARESSAALKELIMFAHKKGCLTGVSEADLAMCGWTPSSSDFSVKALISTEKVAEQETTFTKYLKLYDSLMPADCVKIQPADISIFSAAAKLLACNAEEFGASTSHVDDEFPVDLFLYAYSQHQLKQRDQHPFAGAAPMHIGKEEGASKFKEIWTFLINEVTNAAEFLPFFSLKVFKAADLTALMLVRPAAAANNGNPPQKKMQPPKQRDTDSHTMQSPRLPTQSWGLKSPHPRMKSYLKGDRGAWIQKLFGFEEFRSLAAHPTNSIPPQAVRSITFEDSAAGSACRASFVAFRDLSEDLYREPCYDLVIWGRNTAIQWFNTATTRNDYAWIDLMVAALSALHNDENVELDDVDEVFVVPEEDQDEDGPAGLTLT